MNAPFSGISDPLRTPVQYLKGIGPRKAAVLEKAGITNKPADIDSDRDKIRQCLGTLKDFPGVAGPITMDAVRDGTGITAILKVVNGKYVNIAK